jgi:serine/threonine protein phosphatase PrpC
LKTPGSPYTSVKTLSFSEDMNPRYRSTMEDASAMLDGFGGDAGTGYFGVYDGHGGRNVAEFLRLHLHVNVENELRLKGDRSVEECLKAAFLYTDIMCHGTGEQASGSTSVVCLVRKDATSKKRYVYTANCGDARAVLCHKGAAVRLSKVREAAHAKPFPLPLDCHSPSLHPSPPPPVPLTHPSYLPSLHSHSTAHRQDHKATDVAERTRIEAAGGFVVRKRVMGVLAVARSFGDFVLKKFVSAEPYTSTTMLDGDVRPAFPPLLPPQSLPHLLPFLTHPPHTRPHFCRASLSSLPAMGFGTSWRTRRQWTWCEPTWARTKCFRPRRGRTSRTSSLRPPFPRVPLITLQHALYCSKCILLPFFYATT